ncbi:putative signal peptide, camelysin [Helianthus annuus]|uniref:Signal peptide, camelysin n=2 Tax=Helianthus annuus TaxID=4232 RepID=A0A9K3JTC1_HELAN|nr:putative signal peptide, camelysin [Helianthus annuus]KAJ0956292.1 putative signal peptide, camelysin [Helianthus annuus]
MASSRVSSKVQIKKIRWERTVVVAAVSLLGTLPALASFSDSTNTTNKWVTRALALPTAGTASKKEIRLKQNLR